MAVFDQVGPAPDLAVLFVTGAHLGACEDIAGAEERGAFEGEGGGGAVEGDVGTQDVEEAVAIATSIADALSSGSARTYAEDDDPELVRDAAPFGLKTIEALLERHPEHEGLLTALASGFTSLDVEVVDLEGARVHPGLKDWHAHLVPTGLPLRTADLVA